MQNYISNVQWADGGHSFKTNVEWNNTVNFTAHSELQNHTAIKFINLTVSNKSTSY